MYWCVEAPDGAGKTTVMQGIARALMTKGIDNFLLTKEPGGPLALQQEWNLPTDDPLQGRFGYSYPTGPQIRKFCVDHPEIPQLAKRALYKADSLCNWEHVIKPAIQSDAFVLSDRSWISDLVYGSVLVKLDMHALFQFNMTLTPQLHRITKVLYLSVDSDNRERRLARNMADHMDTLGPKIRDELAATYIKVLNEYIHPEQYWIIDANRPVEVVIADAVRVILEAKE